MQTTTRQRDPNQTTWIAGALLGLLVVLLLRRYAGINHDSVLYLGQGLARRWPGIYGSDLVFVHGGGQDHYTLFPLLLGQALEWLAPAPLFMWSALGALVVFAAAGWYCLKPLLPAGPRYWAWLGVLCLPTIYGMVLMFSYSEQFFTPRPIAEASCLLGIGLLARRHLIASLACVVLAGLFHPLQALAACLVVWPWLVMQDRRWLHAMWFAAPVLALAIADIEPFAGLLRQADPKWLFILRDNTPQLFLTRWSEQDFMFLLLDAAVLGYAWRSLRGPFGAWCLAALVGLTLGMGATLVFVDGLHLVLPAGLQLWRVHWLAHWFAMAAIAVLLYHDLEARDFSRALVLALTLLLAWGQASWIWALAFMLYAAWPKVMVGRPPRVSRLLGRLCGIGIAIMLASHAYSEFTVFRMAHYRLDLYAFDRRLLVYPLLALGLPLLALHGWNRASERQRALLLGCLLLPLVAFAASRWDLRSPEVRAFEQATFRSDLFGVDIPRDAQVFWAYDRLTGPWLVLQRASFFSPHQLSGQVFNRDMAMDGRRRLDRLYPLLAEYLGCMDRSRSYEDRQNCHISDQAMRQACAPGPDPRPDYIVLPYAQPQRAAGSWTLVDPVTRDVMETFRLYRCRDVMEDLATTRTGGH
jgi:hypothetical protein